jgi:hypothetical protein
MPSAKQHDSEPATHGVPCVSTDEDIRKAQAIRETLRQQLLNQPVSDVHSCWAVSAD